VAGLASQGPLSRKKGTTEEDTKDRKKKKRPTPKGRDRNLCKKKIKERGQGGSAVSGAKKGTSSGLVKPSRGGLTRNTQKEAAGETTRQENL